MAPISSANAFGDLMPGTRAVPFNDLEALEQALASKTIAAFIVEPVQGKSCGVAAEGYLAEAQRLCHAAGTLLVVDEVQCGLGRTGKWFAYQHWPDIQPDIVCVAKALSGGFVPVGAIITSARIMDSVFNSMERCVVHSNTFGQNDLAMAAALATLHVMEEDRLVGKRGAAGWSTPLHVCARLLRVARLWTKCEGKGLMFGIDFKRPEHSMKLKLAWDTLHTLNFGVFSQMLIVPLLHEHRILTQVAGYHTELIKFLPSLTVDKEDMDHFLGAMTEVLDSIQQFPGRAWNTIMDLAKGVLRA